ncbi:MAG: MFS transporter [Xanthobacteraceae bacterium]|nr:MFS transporter [Xanthobacteraceae bacterium]
MSTTPTSAAPAPLPSIFKSPLVIVLFGCLIAIIGFGPRSSFGFFLTPISSAYGWGRDVFALAFAIQNLLWGLGSPFAGALADRYGTARVLSIGAALYCVGLALMTYSTTPITLDLTAGVLIGFGLSACSFNIVLTAFGKLVPKEWQGLAFGAGTAAGSFGQFLFAPFGVALIQNYGWQFALLVFSALVLLVIPFSMALRTASNRQAVTSANATPAQAQSLREALAEAFGHKSYVLLVTGFFTCGFQLAFVTAHLPSYLLDRGLSAEVGGWTLAIIGLCNIVGSFASGWLGNRIPKRYILSAIYLTRALSIAVFISMPPSVEATMIFAVITGLTWLSTVPPTSSLVSIMFGTRWFAMLYGFVFFSHQVGSFLGVYLGGIAFEKFGSYDMVWWLSVTFGVLSALINLPIVEKPVARLLSQAT